MKQLLRRENSSIIASGAGILVVALVSLMAIEPAITRAITDDFTVSQSVTAEIAFSSNAADVTLGPSIPGLSGGTANGETDVRIKTNNPAGYNLGISFSTTTAMQGNEFGGEIPNYTPSSTTTPDFAFSVGANTGEFAYTVEAEESADLVSSFLDDGGTCGAGSTDTADSCWEAPSTTVNTVVNRTSVTDSDGASTTLKFRVQLTADPDPVIPADTYTATATLTAVMN